MNNIIIIISVPLIVAIFMYIPLKCSEVLPIRNTYRPPLTINEFKAKRMRKLPKPDPNLIQYKYGRR